MYRPYIERTTASQNMFPSERDLGVHAKTSVSDTLALDLREHGLEGRQIPVDVVERGDAHPNRTALFDDLEQRPAAAAGRRGPHHRAQRAGDAALTADHLAHVVLGDVELQDRVAVAFDLLHAHGVRLVDQAASQVLDELGGHATKRPWP